MPPRRRRTGSHVKIVSTAGGMREERSSLTPVQLRMWEIIGAAPPGSLSVIGYGGAAGGGKTRALIELAEDLCLDYPGNKVLIGRQRFNDLRTSTMEQFDLYVPPSIVVGRNDTEHWREIRLPDWPEGVVSTVIFRNMSDWAGLMGQEYGAILIDEAGQVSENAANACLSRIRWKLPPEVDAMRGGKPIKRVLACASNPWPGFFKKWFIDRELDEALLRKFDGSLYFIPALAKDNPYLPENYEEQLRAIYPPEWVKRFLDGRWDAFMGQVYPDFSPAIHEWKYGKLPDPSAWERVVGGLDFGGHNPYSHFSAGVVCVVLQTGRVIVVDEFEERGPNVVERQMDWIGEMEKKYANRFTGQIQWRADKSQMMGIRMWQRGGLIVAKSDGSPGSVMVGVARIQRLMSRDASGLPGFFYMPHLTQLPQRLIAYRYPEPPDDEDKAIRPNPLKKDDDLPDALRYALEIVGDSYAAPEEIQRYHLPTVEAATEPVPLLLGSA